MKKPAKVLILSSIAVLISALVVFSAVKAGSLTPPSLGATMYTLEDIYQRLTTGATADSHSLAPSGAPASTMHDLIDIYSAIPTINAEEVCSAATYLGTSGTAVCGGTPALVWQTDQDINLNWDAAVAYCAGLTTGGYTWRLPTLGELSKGLVDQFVDGTGSGGFKGDYAYWSISATGSTAWASDYNSVDNNVYHSNDAKFNTYAVRCVH